MVLEQWAEWQKGYTPKLGFAPKSCGIESGYSSKTFEDLEHEADAYMHEAVDAAIDDLLPALRAAIYRRYLCAVFRLQRISYEVALADAHDELIVRLVRKGICL